MKRFFSIFSRKVEPDKIRGSGNRDCSSDTFNRLALLRANELCDFWASDEGSWEVALTLTKYFEQHGEFVGVDFAHVEILMQAYQSFGVSGLVAYAALRLNEAPLTKAQTVEFWCAISFLFDALEFGRSKILLSPDHAST